jgi:hypothetical protein
MQARRNKPMINQIAVLDFKIQDYDLRPHFQRMVSKGDSIKDGITICGNSVIVSFFLGRIVRF